MGDSYSRVREKSQAESLAQRAELVSEFLTNLDPIERRETEKSWQWLHILGPSGLGSAQ